MQVGLVRLVVRKIPRIPVERPDVEDALPIRRFLGVQLEPLP